MNRELRVLCGILSKVFSKTYLVDVRANNHKCTRYISRSYEAALATIGM